MTPKKRRKFQIKNMARKRIVLNGSAVREIQSLAPSFADVMRRGCKSQRSIALAARFGVNAKTIRDIWNRRSWTSRSNQTDSLNEYEDSTDRKDDVVLHGVGSPGAGSDSSEVCIDWDDLGSPDAESEVWDHHFHWNDLFE